MGLRQLKVEGDTQHNTAASIRSQVLPQLRGNYLSLDLQEARSAFEAVPWVRRAQVRRVWPDQLVVQLQEHQPVAYWERDDSDDLLPAIVLEAGPKQVRAYLRGGDLLKIGEEGLKFAARMLDV